MHYFFPPSSISIPAHLLQRQYELGDALLAAKVGQQLVGVHTLAVSSLHQLGNDALHLLLLSHSPKQLVVENLIKGKQERFNKKGLNPVTVAIFDTWHSGVYVHLWCETFLHR